MTIPPILSGGGFPPGFGGETQSSYLNGGIVFNAAYTDNVLAGETAAPISDFTYSIWPKIQLEDNTTRRNMSLLYSSGFTFYRRESVLDAVNQNAALDYHYRLSPHETIYVQDSFQQNSNVFSQPFGLSGGTVNASTSSPTANVIVPFASLDTNTTNAGLSYQFSKVGMIGGGATFALLDYPAPNQVPGLYNSRTAGGTAFSVGYSPGTNTLAEATSIQWSRRHPQTQPCNCRLFRFSTPFSYIMTFRYQYLPAPRNLESRCPRCLPHHRGPRIFAQTRHGRTTMQASRSATYKLSPRAGGC